MNLLSDKLAGRMKQEHTAGEVPRRSSSLILSPIRKNTKEEERRKERKENRKKPNGDALCKICTLFFMPHSTNGYKVVI